VRLGRPRASPFVATATSRTFLRTKHAPWWTSFSHGAVRAEVKKRAKGWFRPLCLSASQGYWVNLLKVTRAGVLSRHRHTNPVHGYVLKGRWHYLEHDWVAEQGGYVYEPPGETHTLVVPEDVEEMITLFQVNGIMLYVDPVGNTLGYEDVFSKIAMCRRHYQECGLGANYVEQFIR
jgi:2,4'-dihydroxyacetophenone dioxygenase